MPVVLREQDQIPGKHVKDFMAVSQAYFAVAFTEEMEEHHMIGSGEPLPDACAPVLATNAPRRGEFGVEVKRAVEPNRLQNDRQGVHGVSDKNRGVPANLEGPTASIVASIRPKE
jgi:hypothetical protein